MQNSLYHFPLSPPPPPRPPPTKQNLTTLYYGLVIIGSTAIIIAIYNLIILKCCPARQERLQRLRDMAASSGRRSLDDFSIHLGATTFKYKKEGQGSLKLGFDNYECPVCLSAFEEEEEVRQLPRCKHSFHAPCIDMWLYSHLDCPLCRAPVELPVFPLETGRNTSERSREVLIDSGILV